MTLGKKILILVFVSFLIPVMFICLVSYGKLRQMFLNQSITAAISATQKNAQQFDMFCNTMEKNLSNTANSINLKNYRTVRVNFTSDTLLLMNYTRLVNSELTSFMSYSSDIIRGLLLLWDDMSTPVIKGYPSFPFTTDYRQNDLYQKALHTPLEPIWSFSKPQNGQPYITIAAPVMDGYISNPAGVLIMELRASILNDYFGSIINERGEKIIVLDQNHTVLHDTQNELIGSVAEWSWLNDMGTRENGFQAKLGNINYLVTYDVAPITGWTVICLLPYSRITDSLQPQQQIYLMMFLVTSCAAFLVASMTYSMFYKPIKALMRVMTSFGDGHLDARITVRKKDEIAVLFNKFNMMANQIRELVKQVENYQKKQKDVEILFLQAQIIPHFLANALASISAMAKLGRKNEIVEMSNSLDRLLRIVSIRDVMIPLAEELCYILEYMNVMHLRYKMRIAVEYEVPDEAMQVLLPKFTLQPIIENCIVHAFNDQSIDPKITISCRFESKNLVITIWDNGYGTENRPILDNDKADENTGRFNHIGLKNINERLHLLFDEPDCGLFFSSEVNRGSTVIVVIPVRYQDRK